MYCLLQFCFEKCVRLVKKIKLRYICICIGFIALFDYFGVFTHIFEITYDSNFAYPYNGNVHEFVNALKHNEKPTVNPINDYNYTILIDNQQKCIDPAYNTFRVVYIVKSAIENFERRSAIRNSWGFEKRFFDVPSRTIFMLGVHPHDDELQEKVKIEAEKYKDIVQASFADMYYNNTIKTMMSFKWLVKYCSNSKFYMFVDDDIYVSVKNVLRFIRNPANYPDYFKEPRKFEAHKREIKDTDNMKDEAYINNSGTQRNGKLRKNFNTEEIIHELKQKSPNKSLETTFSVSTEFLSDRRKRQIFDFELPEDVRLFAGFVLVSSPHRHKSSK